MPESEVISVIPTPTLQEYLMAEVIPLHTVRQAVKPKEETLYYQGQRILLRYDPNAPIGSQWVWTVDYTVKYPYIGSASTIQSAKNAARRKIRSLTGQNEKWEA